MLPVLKSDSTFFTFFCFLSTFWCSESSLSLRKPFFSGTEPHRGRFFQQCLPTYKKFMPRVCLREYVKMSLSLESYFCDVPCETIWTKGKILWLKNSCRKVSWTFVIGLNLFRCYKYRSQSSTRNLWETLGWWAFLGVVQAINRPFACYLLLLLPIS